MCNRGSSAVEFAIIAPIFLLLFFGMIAYAIYFSAMHAVQQLSADAARVSISGISKKERDELVQGFLDANASSYMMLNADLLVYHIGDAPNDPTQYQVSISYDASELPIWNLYPPIPLPSQTITFSSTIRKGGL